MTLKRLQSPFVGLQRGSLEIVLVLSTGGCLTLYTGTYSHETDPKIECILTVAETETLEFISTLSTLVKSETRFD